ADGHTVLSLTSAELAAIGQAFTITPALGNANNGGVDWSYRLADGALDFLGEGETVTLISTVAVDDHHGGADTASVTVTLKGADDAPVIASADKAETATVNEAALTSGDPTPHLQTGTIH